MHSPLANLTYLHIYIAKHVNSTLAWPTNVPTSPKKKMSTDMEPFYKHSVGTCTTSVQKTQKVLANEPNDVDSKTQARQWNSSTSVRLHICSRWYTNANIHYQLQACQSNSTCWKQDGKSCPGQMIHKQVHKTIWHMFLNQWGIA